MVHPSRFGARCKSGVAVDAAGGGSVSSFSESTQKLAFLCQERSSNSHQDFDIHLYGVLALRGKWEARGLGMYC